MLNFSPKLGHFSLPKLRHRQNSARSSFVLSCHSPKLSNIPSVQCTASSGTVTRPQNGFWLHLTSCSGSLYLAPLHPRGPPASHASANTARPQQWQRQQQAPSSALSVLKHLLHVQSSTALNSGKSKPILTGTLQDTSLQWRLSVWQIQACFPQLFWH